MNIKIDSRKIEEGDIFVALNTYNDGHKFVFDAIERGAKKVIVNKGSYDVETIIVPDTKDYLINHLKNNYYDQIKDLKLIGITGTNGKTTTAYLLWQALNKLGHKCAYIGTIGFYIEDKIRDLPNTTPEIADIYEMLIECKEQTCEYVVMEVSSHALEQRRVDGLKFDYAIFTNLTEDHLDYHKSMGNYALAKQKLFSMLKDNGKSIINIDDKYHEYFSKNNDITYGFKESQFQIQDYNINFKNNFTLKINGEIYDFESNLLGKYNIYNITSVIAILYDLKIDMEIIRYLVSTLNPPIGRMEIIDYNTNKIIIDYAHTPDAVQNIINAVKEFGDGKIYTIIGCGGNRDKMKREVMGNIATNNSDYVIFTSDNPRDEEPEAIIEDMTNNLENNNYQIEINREKAINKGIQKLTKNDILLVLGKGHETYQIIKGEKIYFSDKEKIMDFIRR